ncbi:MAG: DUF192 domain-containing protein [Bdellovibrionota bacterium]
MFGTSREVFVYNQTKGTFLAFRVGVADSILGRLIGLLGRKSLKPDGGVWIVPANAIHTVGMLFSFDVVMIDKDFRVVSVTEMLKPFRVLLPKLRAESVIELPAHTIFRSRTEVGDQLLIDRYEAKKVAEPQSPAMLEKVTAIPTPGADLSLTVNTPRPSPRSQYCGRHPHSTEPHTRV